MVLTLTLSHIFRRGKVAVHRWLHVSEILLFTFIQKANYRHKLITILSNVEIKTVN